MCKEYLYSFAHFPLLSIFYKIAQPPFRKFSKIIVTIFEMFSFTFLTIMMQNAKTMGFPFREMGRPRLLLFYCQASPKWQ